VEGVGSVEAPSADIQQIPVSSSQPEAEALRAGVMIIGFLLLVTGIAYGAIHVYSMVAFSDSRWNDADLFIWTNGVIGTLTQVGSATIGMLLVLSSLSPAARTVRGILYPTLVIIGTYLAFLGVMDLVFLVADVVMFDEILGFWNYVYFSISPVPYLLGGILLILAGTRNAGRRRDGRPVVVSRSDTYP
jgi:hypothetical protein